MNVKYPACTRHLLSSTFPPSTALIPHLYKTLSINTTVISSKHSYIVRNTLPPQERSTTSIHLATAIRQTTEKPTNHGVLRSGSYTFWRHQPRPHAHRQPLGRRRGQGAARGRHGGRRRVGDRRGDQGARELEAGGEEFVILLPPFLCIEGWGGTGLAFTRGSLMPCGPSCPTRCVRCASRVRVSPPIIPRPDGETWCEHTHTAVFRPLLGWDLRDIARLGGVGWVSPAA